jgi:hypothetical protein
VNHISLFKFWKTSILSHDSVQEVLSSHLRSDWGFYGFSQSRSTITGIISKIRPRPLRSTFFESYCLLIILPFRIRDFELPIASLNTCLYVIVFRSFTASHCHLWIWPDKQKSRSELMEPTFLPRTCSPACWSCSVNVIYSNNVIYNVAVLLGPITVTVRSKAGYTYSDIGRMTSVRFMSHQVVEYKV